jgi:type VI secretion system protein ImpC
VIVGRYTFEPTAEDAALLGQAARFGAAVGAPFLAAAGDRFLGCDSLADHPDPDDWSAPPDPDGAWAELRSRPEAVWAGLALPRFLLRLPYGKDATPAERFEFEELPEDEARANHGRYLWGNPAVACAFLLAEAYQQGGWGFRAGEVSEVDGLPQHVYAAAGESQVKPCGEVWLVDRAVEAAWEKGLMPLVSVRGRDAVQVPGFRSLAEPPRALAGFGQS